MRRQIGKVPAGRPRTAILAAFLLFVGTTPYLLWNRDAPFLAPLRDLLPSVPPPAHGVLTDFLRYNFADGAWFLSLLLMQRYLGGSATFGLSALLLAVGLEAGQYVGLLPGTFDTADLLTYITLFILFKICTRKRHSATSCFWWRSPRWP